MNVALDFMQDTPVKAARPVAHPVHTLDGGRLMVRGGQSVMGAALILSAMGLWIMPGSDISGDVLLFKLVLSLIIGLTGIALTQQGKTPKTPEVEIDTVRREVRLVRRNGANSECVQSCKFADLDRAEVQGVHVVLWGPGNVMLAEVALSDPKIRGNLMSGLMDAGKI